MKVQYIVREVLDQYVGSQINIDSEAARDILAKHIASEIETTDFWNNMDQGQCYNIERSLETPTTKQNDYVDDDLAV